MWIFLLLIILVPLTMIVVGILVSAPRYSGPVSDHFDGKRFINPDGVQAKGLREVLKWMVNRKRGSWHYAALPSEGKRPPDTEKENIRITFINHTTFLIQVDGLNILTDPIWSRRTSPFRWVGPKRMKPPGIGLEKLPRIHAVLLSHNHYDHLDLPTMRTIFGGHHPRIITPLGVKQFLDGERITGAVDVDWWQQIALSDTVKITAVPAQHFSGRGMLDRDGTLWCGYCMTTNAGNLYFAGDTGYNDKTFKEIGTRCGPFDVSIIPIGAYQPAWFMSPIHVSPYEAVNIHQDVRSKVSIASHFGTFPLADDGEDDPVRDLKAALNKNHLTPEDFIVMQQGEGRVFERLPEKV